MANQTIYLISCGSELFAKSIMSKVQDTVFSGKFSSDTCRHLIEAIGNVSGDSKTAMSLFETVVQLYTQGQQFGDDQGVIDASLVRTLIKVAQKAPLIVERTLGFLMEIGCLEGVQILSRTFDLGK